MKKYSGDLLQNPSIRELDLKPQRDEKGRWLKGGSGNPHGRGYALPAEVRTQLESLVPDAIAQLQEIIRGKKKTRTRPNIEYYFSQTESNDSIEIEEVYYELYPANLRLQAIDLLFGRLYGKSHGNGTTIAVQVVNDITEQLSEQSAAEVFEV